MKFILTDEKHPKYNAYRIMAKESSEKRKITSGDLGGYVEKKENLDETSDAWIFDDSVVLGNSLITGETEIRDKAILENVNVGFDSSISTVSISNITFSNKIRIYGDKKSIVIADQELQFGAITANRFINGPGVQSEKSIYIGYSKFIGTIEDFDNFVKRGCVKPEDEALFVYYLPIIKSYLS